MSMCSTESIYETTLLNNNSEKSISLNEVDLFKLNSSLNINKSVEIYHCDECKNDFKSRQEYFKHRLFHKNWLIKNRSNIFAEAIIRCCPLCSYQTEITFGKYSERSPNYDENHANLIAFYNKECLTIEYTIDYEKKENYITAKRLFPCITCSEVFLQKELYIKHISTHLTCSICSKIFIRSANVHKHIKNVHKKYICLICGKIFLRASSLKEHGSMHPDYKCTLCIKKFQKKTQLNDHLQRVHINRKNAFSCDMCSKTFSWKYDLATHRKQHKNKDLECSNCQKIFLRKRDFERHNRTHNRTEKKFQCHICAKKFVSDESLRYHQRTHNDKQCFKCSYCDKRYPFEGELRRHITTVHNTGEKIFKCMVCEKVFANATYLKCHEGIHRKDDHLKCPHCPKKFYPVSQLNQHIRRMHIKERFTCERCSKIFTSKRYLSKHSKICENIL